MFVRTSFVATMCLVAGLAAAQAQSASPSTPTESSPPSAGAESGGDKTPQAAGEESDISGAEEFVRYCSVCHGLDGTGKGPLAPALKKPPADLTQISKRNNGHFPFSKIARTIRDGGEIASHGSSDMPAWGEVFRDHVDPIMARALIFEMTLYLEEIQK